MSTPTLVNALAKTEKEEQTKKDRAQKKRAQEERLLHLLQEIREEAATLKAQYTEMHLELSNLEKKTLELLRSWHDIEAITQRIYLMTDHQLEKKKWNLIGISLLIGFLLGALLNYGSVFFLR